MQPGLPQVRVVCDSPPWTMVSAAARSWRSRICLLIYIIVSFRENFVKRQVTFEHQLGKGNRVFPCPQASFLRRKVATTSRIWANADFVNGKLPTQQIGRQS